MKLFSLTDLSCIHTFAAHTSAVLQVPEVSVFQFQAAFVRNGAQFVSADSGGILRVWTISSGESENTFEAHDDKVLCITHFEVSLFVVQIWTVCVRGGGEEVVTAGSDGQIIVWKDVTEEKRAEEEVKRREKIQQEQVQSCIIRMARP